MQKIASPKDLQAELQRILAYSQEKNPSREKLASELRELADRTAKTEVEIRNPRDIARAYQKLPTNPKIYWDVYGSLMELDDMGLTGKFGKGETVYFGTHKFRSGGWKLGRDGVGHLPLTFIGWLSY